MVVGPYGNTSGYVSGPQGNTVAGTTAGSQITGYSGSNGISASQIPAGQQDLYILKSDIVPPSNPSATCPVIVPRQEPCPACPTPGRCPQNQYKCKMVPDYNAIQPENLPVPVLNSFSSFGM